MMTKLRYADHLVFILLGRSSRIFFKKGLGRRGKGPEKAHGEPVTKSNSVALFRSTVPARYLVGPASIEALQLIVVINVGTQARACVWNPRTRSSD